MSNYRKTMSDALQEMYSLDESVIDKVKEIASKKSAKKIDGVMVDSFTASAISQIYDKVNDANKKKMEKLPITNLANLAMKMMQKNDYVPEEADLDEALSSKDQKAIEDYVSKFMSKMTPDLKAKMEKDPKAAAAVLAKMAMNTEDLDEADDFKPHMMYDPKTGKGYKADTMDDHLRMKKMGYNHDAPKTEEVDLDEDEFGKFQDYARLYGGGDEIYVVTQGKDASGGRGEHQQKVVGIAKDPNKAKKIRDAANKQNPKAKARIYGQMKQSQKTFKLKVGDPVSFEDSKNKLSFIEEVELDEGKMSQLHQYIKDKKSPEEIAKLMKLDVKTIKSLMSSHHPEEVEESAASDARRAMSKDKDFSRKDSADDDDDATDDDVKAASKNIIMQMRKAVSMRGNFKVEFGDKKKVKIPAKIAQAVQAKYNSLKKPSDKEKFQAQVAKSHKDMLQSLKAGYMMKAAYEEVKKESVLDRIDRKIKEKNNG